jgi:hypothetical protein
MSEKWLAEMLTIMERNKETNYADAGDDPRPAHLFASSTKVLFLFGSVAPFHIP